MRSQRSVELKSEVILHITFSESCRITLPVNNAKPIQIVPVHFSEIIRVEAISVESCWQSRRSVHGISISLTYKQAPVSGLRCATGPKEVDKR